MHKLYHKVESLQDKLIDVATGGTCENEVYRALRSELLSDNTIGALLPNFVKENRTLGEFWQYIKYEKETYQERRVFIWENFKLVLNILETTDTSSEFNITHNINNLSEELIQREWSKALARKAYDPEGAITSSRTLVECVCKFILDQLDISYSDSLEFPKLYKLTASSLKLAPEQHQEQIFKQILGGCQSVVEGLASLRNKLSDSHGMRIHTVRPSTKHAAFAVNLAGSMSMFLLESFNEKRKKECVKSNVTSSV